MERWVGKRLEQKCDFCLLGRQRRWEHLNVEEDPSLFNRHEFLLASVISCAQAGETL